MSCLWHLDVCGNHSHSYHRINGSGSHVKQKNINAINAGFSLALAIIHLALAGFFLPPPNPMYSSILTHGENKLWNAWVISCYPNFTVSKPLQTIPITWYVSYNRWFIIPSHPSKILFNQSAGLSFWQKVTSPYSSASKILHFRVAAVELVTCATVKQVTFCLSSPEQLLDTPRTPRTPSYRSWSESMLVMFSGFPMV